MEVIEPQEIIQFDSYKIQGSSYENLELRCGWMEKQTDEQGCILARYSGDTNFLRLTDCLAFYPFEIENFSWIIAVIFTL